jgi:hypothetical protein
MGMMLPGKKRYNPNVQLKRLNWVKLQPQKIKGTLWEDADEEQYEGDMPFDELEMLFASNPAVSVLAAPAVQAREATVIEPKKHYNLCMLQRASLGSDIH